MLGGGGGGKAGKKGEIGWHPFESDYGDHFETSDSAYTDIAPILAKLAQVMGKRASELSIYDPYYCAGAVVGRLKSLGFGKVYNRNEDCYKVWREKREPKYDVIVTNPPFSGDHKERCLTHCVEGKQLWACLLPSYCATKQYFQTITAPCKQGLVFAVPEATYEFQHPEGTGHAASPFHSMWFLHLGEHTQAILAWFRAQKRESGGVRLCCSVSELEASNAVRSGKRPNPKQRKAMAAKKRMGGQ